MGGATFLDLQLITSTTVEEASTFFTAYSFGFMLGAVLSGVLGRRVDRTAVIGAAFVGLGVCIMVTPHCKVYAVMVAIRSLDGVFIGLVDVSGNAEHMVMWGNDGRTLYYFLHFSFSLGAFISPLYAEPFLSF